MAHPLSQRIDEVLALDAEAPAMQYDGQWSTWGQVAAAADHVRAVAGNGLVGIMLRNSPAHVAALLGVLSGGGTVVVINPSRGDTRTRHDIADLHLPMIVGLADDLELLAPDTTATTVAIAGLDAAPVVTPGTAFDDPGRPDVAVLMLTSGTTGFTEAGRPHLRHAGTQRDGP